MAAIIAALPFVLLLVAYHELPRIPVMRSSRFRLRCDPTHGSKTMLETNPIGQCGRPATSEQRKLKTTRETPQLGTQAKVTGATARCCSALLEALEAVINGPAENGSQLAAGAQRERKYYVSLTRSVGNAPMEFILHTVREKGKRSARTNA